MNLQNDKYLVSCVSFYRSLRGCDNPKAQTDDRLAHLKRGCLAGSMRGVKGVSFLGTIMRIVTLSLPRHTDLLEYCKQYWSNIDLLYQVNEKAAA